MIMEEPRRIVLVLGNGFDLDLGLKTLYKDFWDSKFCPKDYPAPLIFHLNNHWPDNQEAVKWYDLENELYYYAKKLISAGPRKDIITESERKFLEIVKPEYICFGIYNDYSDQMNSLLQKGIIVEDLTYIHRYRIPYQEDLLKSPVERDTIALERIKKGLCEYLQLLPLPQNEQDTVAYSVLLSILKTADKGEFVEIFSFNYTPVRRLGYMVDEVPVHYMHGCSDDGNVIIGTRDDTEIEKDYAFLQKALDPTFYPPQLVSSLHAADEVIIFGHSIGENDRQYFKAFFKQQTDYSHTKGKDIIIFTRDHASEVQIKLALQNMTDGNLSTLFGLNRVQIIKSKELKEDQKRFLDFLIAHHTDEHYAANVIGKLMHKSL